MNEKEMSSRTYSSYIYRLKFPKEGTINGGGDCGNYYISTDCTFQENYRRLF